MIANVILGVTVDTTQWIKELKANGSEHIIVLDYDRTDDPIKKDSIIYISTFEIKNYLQNFDSFVFYKSFYSYPGMNGTMASLYRKKK